jgi:hypothetical protein
MTEPTPEPTPTIRLTSEMGYNTDRRYLVG